MLRFKNFRHLTRRITGHIRGTRTWKSKAFCFWYVF